MPPVRTFNSPDGVRWAVEARAPGASNAMIVFHHPAGSPARKDRYAWVNWHGPEARNVTARLDGKTVLGALDDAALAVLFRQSLPVSGFGTIGTSRHPRLSGLGALRRGA
jgi:hypothetical protein